MLSAAVTQERLPGIDPRVPRSSLASLNVTHMYSPQEFLYECLPIEEPTRRNTMITQIMLMVHGTVIHAKTSISKCLKLAKTAEALIHVALWTTKFSS